MSNKSKTPFVNTVDDLSSNSESEYEVKIQVKDNNIPQEYVHPHYNESCPNTSSKTSQPTYVKHNNNEFRSISTKESKIPQTNKQQNYPETIGKIIQNLDNFSDNTLNTDDNKEYVTNGKFSTLISEIKVDILSMVNLLDALNESVNNNNIEINSIKRDIRTLINENVQLKKKLRKNKEESDKMYNSLCIAFDVKFNDLKKSQKIEQTDNKSQKIEHTETKINQDHFTDDNKSFSHEDESKSTNGIRVIRRNHTDANTYGSSNKDANTYGSSNKDANTYGSVNTNDAFIFDKQEPSNVNVYVDSQMEKRATKFKSAKPRIKSSTSDVFGVEEQKDERPIFNGNFRQVARTDIIETKLNSQTDTSTSRANRLNLHSNSMVDKFSAKRI